jgi:hypothetical protein
MARVFLIWPSAAVDAKAQVTLTLAFGVNDCCEVLLVGPLNQECGLRKAGWSFEVGAGRLVEPGADFKRGVVESKRRGKRKLLGKLSSPSDRFG